MTKQLRILLTALAFFSACSACSSGKPKMVFNNGEKTVITGSMMLVGNEPMSKLIIKTESAQIILPKDIRDSHRDLIGKTVTVEGIINAQLIESADHKHKYYQYVMNKPEFK